MNNKQISISIILPIFNEIKSLEFVINSWHSYFSKKNIIHTFLLCEDGSTDGTKEIIPSLIKIYPCKNLSTIRRRGYGAAVLEGISNATTSHILCIDSDGQCLPDSFDSFLKEISKCDLLIGNRKPRMDPAIRIIYSKLFHFFFRLLFKTAISDPSCPYVFGKKEVFLKLKNYLKFMREGFWWGFVGACIKLNINIKELKIKHFRRKDGSSVVYKPSKMPAIIFRNILGLIKLKNASN
jgi:glycosyltransferase involved in cell wall biosynthesis